MKILSPMNDFVFKALFGREDQTSKLLLIDLLNEILKSKGEDTIVSLVYLNPFNYKEYEADKLSVLDIKAKTEKGERVNIEVQVKPEPDYRKRSLYYWAKTYAETIGESEPYSSLKKTIVINIMDYNVISESEKLHTHFKIIEREEEFVLTEDLQIHYLELPKLTEEKSIEAMAGLELWIAFLKIAGKEGSEEKLNKITERSGSIKMAIKSLESISADEKMRELYRAREKARRDMISQLYNAEKKAKEEGNITALQGTLIKQFRRKLGAISNEMEKKILETKNTSLLENALENIFDLESEKDLLELLNK